MSDCGFKRAAKAQSASSRITRKFTLKQQLHGLYRTYTDAQFTGYALGVVKKDELSLRVDLQGRSRAMRYASTAMGAFILIPSDILGQPLNRDAGFFEIFYTLFIIPFFPAQLDNEQSLLPGIDSGF